MRDDVRIGPRDPDGGQSGFRSAELDVQPRTLRRQFAEEGTSFRELLNEACSTLAVDLVRNVGLTVEVVSKRLGYTDTSTFCHVQAMAMACHRALTRGQARFAAATELNDGLRPHLRTSHVTIDQHQCRDTKSIGAVVD